MRSKNKLFLRSVLTPVPTPNLELPLDLTDKMKFADNNDSYERILDKEHQHQPERSVELGPVCTKTWWHGRRQR